MKNKLSILFTALLLMAAICTVFGFFAFKRMSQDLPDYEQLKNYNPVVTTRIYAADGSLATEFAKEKRTFVPIDIIPKNLINAFLAAEDANFYKHSGIDPFAIFRTSLQNAMSYLKGDPSLGGASTITQQVVKNLLLTRERTFQRKIKEAILASRMSQAFSKDQILELYLNQIYLGSGAYGVAAAAQVYFNKSIDELTIEESAFLATLPKAPSQKDLEKRKSRRDWVLSRMVDEGFIDEKEAKEAAEKPIKLTTSATEDYAKASFFTDSVKKQLTELYGSDNVFESGYVVRTTLDPELQAMANEAFEAGVEDYDKKHGFHGILKKIDASGKWQEELKKYDPKKIYKESWRKAVVISITHDAATIGTEDGDLGSIELSSIKWARKFIDTDHMGPAVKKISDVLNVGDVILVSKSAKGDVYDLHQIPNVNGGMVVMDPNSGRVLAMIGGYVDAPNQFNRATQAMRQPGSTMKTFGYIAALENGMTPATIIMDEEISLNQGIGLPPYKPTNYSGHFYGPTTLRTGLETSRNVTTVRMADQVGLDKVVETVKRFGVNDNPQKIYSLVLGSTETSIMRMVTAYSMMVNGGKKITPSIIEKIQDRAGLTIYRRDNRKCEDCLVDDSGSIAIPVLAENQERVTDAATAYQITSMLQGVVDRGTAMRARSVGKIIGGKTGTTNNSYDSWFVGFSPDLVAGVYIGFDTPQSLGSDETGASVALPVFINFMKNALKNTPSTPFRVPNSVKFVKIDRNTGKFPSSSTAKDNVFFEAFKTDDSLENITSDEDQEEDTKSNSLETIESDSDPVGIY